MQKVTKFIEAYVQWVALGLGIVWILWIGFAYWAKPPVVAAVTTPSGPKELGPSEIDDMTRDGPVANIDKGLKDKLPIPPKVKETLEQQGVEYVADFKSKMALNDSPATPMKPVFLGPVDKSKGAAPTTGPTQDEKVPLPVLAGTGVIDKPEVSSGLSVAWVPNPDKPALSGNTPGAPAPSQIGFQKTDATTSAEAPKVFTRPGAGPDVISILMETADTAWNTVTSRVTQSALRDAFKKAGVPDAQALTLFLRVRLVREEQQPDGSWGKPLYVNDLTNQAKLPWPPANANDEGVYLDWASKNQADIVEPAFYEVLRGTVWRTASMPDMGDVGDPAGANANAADQQIDFAKMKPGDVFNLTPDQKKQYLLWKAEQDKAERDRRKSEAESRKAAQPPSGGGSSGGGAGGGGLRGGKYSPPPAIDQRLSAATPHGAPPPTVERSVSPGRSGRPEVYGGPNSNAATPTLPSNGASTAATPTDRGEFKHGDIPTQRFNPANQGDLEIWGHDTSAVPGHTYRYKLEVSILNPLYKTQNLAKNPADADKFALVVESDWTSPVSVATRQRFFASNGGNGAIGGAPATVKFDYFWWEDGKWNLKNIAVQPGDAIPRTGWTVVDLKPFGNSDRDRENRVLLVNENGDVVSHFYKTDQKDPDYAKLKALVTKAAPAPGSATGSIGQ